MPDNIIDIPRRVPSAVPRPRGWTPSLRGLISDLQHTTDLVVMDVVVDLESRPATYKARITLKASDKPAMERWLEHFNIADPEWEFAGGYTSHHRVSFPITL